VAARRWWRRVGAVAVGLVGVSALVPLMATGGAGTTLAAVTPGNGAILAQPPSVVSLTFSGIPVPTAVHVSVATDDGRTVPSGQPGLSGDSLTVPVQINGDGEYLVAYHVELDDGREFSGINRFRVMAGAPAAAAPAAVSVVGDHAHGDDPTSLVLTAVAAVAVVALIVVMVRPARVHVPRS
jgi:methionine-rich copper-binding protein CopC